MADWLRKLACRLKGHDAFGFQPWGGWPHSPQFGIRSSCRRCGTDTSVAMPSSFAVTRPEGSGRG